MRLAVVSLMGGLPWGGSEALWPALASYALEQGDEVFVSVYDWGYLHEKVKCLQSKGATIHTRKRFNADAGLIERIGRFVKARRPSLNKDYQPIIDFKPGVVFINQGDSFDLAIHHKPLYKLLQENGIAYSFVCHNHDQYSFIPPKEIYPGAVEVFQNAKQVYFVSHRQWQLTERRLAQKISNGQFTWNPLNIAIPEKPLEWPAKDTAYFAMVASLGGTKGHDTAFEVLSAENWRQRPWHLNLYGTGYGEEYLRALAKFYGIERSVSFHGHVSDMLSVWKQNHLLLIPSAGEGLPISLVEAMVCGRPAVVTDVGGNRELVTEGKTGFVAPSPTTEYFTLAMERAWSKKAEWQQVGEAAFQFVNGIVEREPHKLLYTQLTKINSGHKYTYI